MGKGLKDLAKEGEKRGQQQTGFGMRLKLGDGEIAKIRFLTDIDDVWWGYFHQIPASTRLGKRYNKLVYCMAQDNENCPYCDAVGEPVAVQKRRIYFWVYHYYTLHDEREDKNWKKTEEGKYKEEINKVKLLDTGPGNRGYIENRFLAWARKFKTLCDRDYEWIREGLGMEDTSYDLIPDEPSEFVKDVGELVSLEDIAKGKAFMKQAEPEQKEKKSVLDKAKHFLDDDEEKEEKSF